LLLISHVHEFFSFNEVGKIFGELVNAVGHEIFILLSAMRGNENVFHGPERVILRKWLNLEDIKDGSSDLFILEGNDKIFFLNSWSSTNVHENRCWLHLGESGFHVEEI
jgi:hypothetical protein